MGVKSPTADILEGQEEKLRPQSTVRHKCVPRAKAMAQLWSPELETQMSQGWASITALTDRLLPVCLGSCWRLASPTSAPCIRSQYLLLGFSSPHQALSPSSQALLPASNAVLSLFLSVSKPPFYSKDTRCQTAGHPPTA